MIYVQRLSIEAVVDRTNMAFEALTTLIGCLAISTIGESRDAVRNLKTIPTITNSLVNLGKMDISIYFDARDSAMKSDSYLGPSSSFLFSQSEPVMEPCPCSSLRDFKEPIVQKPSNFLNKILMSNDLFSYKEPMTSTLCCDSHEHDDFLTFELGPKHSMKVNPINNNNLHGLDFIFDSLLPRSAKYSPPPKTKAVEIFFFPKKKESVLMPVKSNQLKKESIQIVGGKELRNDFKNFSFKPTESVSSVKKDLTAQEKQETKKVGNIDTNKGQIPTGSSSANAL
ncbi:hypothetical protein evm_005374 [Chilo suppressalis]|nr:hypothetical protein evm_005374 [Chilo suppressalis]